MFFRVFKTCRKKREIFTFFDPKRPKFRPERVFTKKHEKSEKNVKKVVENTPKTREMRNFQNFAPKDRRFVLINDPKSCQIFQILYGNAKITLRETKIKIPFSGHPISQHFSS